MKQDLPKGHTGIQAKRHFDGDRMVIETAPNKRYVFLDRRIGITWPSQYNPGYYAIYGLLDERETPVVMLSERKTDDTIAKMVAGLYAAAMAYRCSSIYADMSDEYGLPYKEVALYSRKLRHDAPGSSTHPTGAQSHVASRSWSSSTTGRLSSSRPAP